MDRKALNEKHYSKKHKINSNLTKRAIQETQQQLSPEELHQLTEYNQEQERINEAISQIVSDKPSWNGDNIHIGGLHYDNFDQEKYTKLERYEYNLLSFEEYKLDSKYAQVNQANLEQYKKNMAIAKNGYYTHPKEKQQSISFKRGKDFKKNPDFHL